MKYYNVELVRTEDRSFSFRFFTNTEIEQLVSQVCISRKKESSKENVSCRSSERREDVYAACRFFFVSSEDEKYALQWLTNSLTNTRLSDNYMFLRCEHTNVKKVFVNKRISCSAKYRLSKAYQSSSLQESRQVTGCNKFLSWPYLILLNSKRNVTINKS